MLYMVRIDEEKNDLHIKAPKMLCDTPLGDCIPRPLPSSHFFMVISGSAGSGKTSFLVSTLSQKEPRIYRNVFENVFIIAPSHSLASIKSSIFKQHNPDKMFNEMTAEALSTIRDRVKEEATEGYNSLLVIDDMTVYLKKKEIEMILKDLIFNRRHYHLSIMLLVQSYTAIPLAIRKTISHAVVFKPKNKKEIQSISDELLFFPKDTIDSVQNYVFKGSHDFLFMSINDGNLYRNFNELTIQE